MLLLLLLLLKLEIGNVVVKDVVVNDVVANDVVVVTVSMRFLGTSKGNLKRKPQKETGTRDENGEETKS